MNDSITVLSETEDARLARNETRISQGLASFVEVGEALSDIRDARLYRATHGTFESYCAEKWGMTKTHCNRLISSAEVAQSLAPIGAKTITTESQARELARVEPARREEVIRKADIATGGKITAAAIKQAAAPAKEIVVTVEESAPRRRHPSPTFSMEDWTSHARNMIRNILSFVPEDRITEARDALHELSENTLPR